MHHCAADANHGDSQLEIGIQLSFKVMMPRGTAEACEQRMESRKRTFNIARRRWAGWTFRDRMDPMDGGDGCSVRFAKKRCFPSINAQPPTINSRAVQFVLPKNGAFSLSTINHPLSTPALFSSFCQKTAVPGAPREHCICN